MYNITLEAGQPPSMDDYTGLQDLASCNKVYDSHALFIASYDLLLIKDSPLFFMQTFKHYIHTWLIQIYNHS